MKLRQECITTRGVIEKGLGEARQTGFPTLNISYTLSGDACLERGVYVAQVRIGKREYQAAACVGADWGAEKTPKFEVYLLNVKKKFARSGTTVEVKLLKKIRVLMRFRDMDEARAQIARDVKKIKKFFVV